MMTKSACLAVACCLLAATVADAQFGGGRHGGRGGGGSSGGPPPADGGGPPTGHVVTPDKVDIVGVVTAIDPATERVTIKYQAVDALNWPAGSQPFAVEKSALLNGVTVGEKVTFRIESQQIYVLKPFVASHASGTAPGVNPS